jgi:hypothetical protein
MNSLRKASSFFSKAATFSVLHTSSEAVTGFELRVSRYLELHESARQERISDEILYM